MADFWQVWRMRKIGPIFASSLFAMKANVSDPETLPTKPIRVGFTCWRWETQRPKALLQLAQRLGVTVKLSVKNRWLQRDVEAQVSGRNVDHFIGEFARR
jgi:uncharacterized protein YfaS (alpha-2-macroglobulin family)